MRQLLTFARHAAAGVSRDSKSLKAALSLLTRDGCAKTPIMASNLDAALSALGVPTDYATINIGTLREDDVRTGYPTPTVLYEAEDIFGMAVPQPPFAEPT